MPAEIMASSSDEAALAWAINQVEDPVNFQARVSAVYQDASCPIRAELRMKDGKVYDHFGAPVRKDGVHYGWVWTFRDITEQKRVEAELRASEAKHEFLNRFNEGIRELTDPGAVMAAAARLLGQHLGASCCAYADVETESKHFHIESDFAEGCAGITGKYHLSLLGAEASSIMQAGRTLMIRDADAELGPGEGADMFRVLGAKALICCPLVKEGELRAMMLVHQKTPRQWKSHEAQLVQAVVERCWSTIERARAERALRESEQRFRQLADAMPQLVWTLSPEGKPEYVNRRWRDYTGIHDVQNQRWLDAVHPDDRDKTLGAWMDAQGEGGDICLEHRLLGQDGYHWFQARVVAIKDSSGRILKWCGSATDFEDVVKARETLARNQAELERLVMERTAKLQDTIAQLEAFSYSISHDMRGPLRAMQGFSYLLLQRFKDKLDPEGIEHLQTIERSAKRLDSLIQDVLTYSRIAREAVRLEPVQVAQLVRDIVNQYPGLQEPQAYVRIEEPIPLVLAQPSYLTQVLSNLISNAVKFVPPERKPEITIEAERRGASVRILIKDNGIGIDPKDQERIFNIFERVYSTDEYEGTGIGLSIVRKAMDRMGGRVGVDSTTGEGSCFWIELQEARS
jgi:PAS domain S-box-containing protein